MGQQLSHEQLKAFIDEDLHGFVDFLGGYFAYRDRGTHAICSVRFKLIRCEMRIFTSLIALKIRFNRCPMKRGCD